MRNKYDDRYDISSDCGMVRTANLNPENYKAIFGKDTLEDILEESDGFIGTVRVAGILNFGSTTYTQKQRIKDWAKK